MASPKKSATKIANNLQKIVGVMKRHLKLWQDSKDQKGRDKHMGHLKKLTKKKKRLEQDLEDTVKSIKNILKERKR